MTSISDLKSLRGQLVSQREDLNRSIESLDRIIARATGDASVPAAEKSAASPFLPLKGAPLRLESGLASVRDMAHYAAVNADVLDFNLNDLAKEREFLLSLGKKSTSQTNLRSIWTDGLSQLITQVERKDKVKPAFDIDTLLAMTEARDPELAVTIVTLANAEATATVKVQVVFNLQSGRAAVIGDRVLTEKQTAALQAQGVSYVSRQDAKSHNKLYDALNTLAAGKSMDVPQLWTIVDAFSYRRENTPQTGSMAERILGPVETTYDNYVVMQSAGKRPGIKAAR